MTENNANNQPFILIVENQIVLARQISFLLRMAGFQTVISTSTVEAMKVIKQHRPDVVLSSTTLNGLSGYDLLRRLRTDYRYEDLPVVLMPTSFNDDDLYLALDLKATDLLPKPFDAFELVDVIQGALLDNQPARKAS